MTDHQQFQLQQYHRLESRLPPCQYQASGLCQQEICTTCRSSQRMPYREDDKLGHRNKVHEGKKKDRHIIRKSSTRVRLTRRPCQGSGLGQGKVNNTFFMTRAEDLRGQKVDCGQRRYSGHKSDRRRPECHQGKLGTWMPSAESWAFLIQRWIVPDASNNWRWKEGREQDVELPCCFFLPTKSSAISTRKCHLEFSSESGETAR